MNSWHSRWGGIEWRVTDAGVETRADGICRTPGEPVTMRTYLRAWGRELDRANAVTGVSHAILLMTIATENGPAVMRGGALSYPATREEPGYESEDATPGRISFGPCHVLLSTARLVLRDPRLSGQQLRDPRVNILAAACYISDQRPVHRDDPILVAACYNAGGLYPAPSSESRFYNRWHLRSWSGHLDRAARWYGDACAVLQETGHTPRLPTALVPGA